MTQFYIIEIKEINSGEFEHQVYYAWDEDPKMAQLKAESKYHEILSEAAISTNYHHSAIIIDSRCFPKLNYSYEHPVVQPEPEPSLEPETESNSEPESTDESLPTSEQLY